MTFTEYIKQSAKAQDKKSRLIKTGIAAAALLVFNALLSLPFALAGQIEDGSRIGPALIVTGLTVTAVWIASITAARILKYESLLRGFFFFGLAGTVFFGAGLAAKLVGGENSGRAVQLIFDWFSFALRPVTFKLEPLIGMSEFYSKAIVFGLFTVGAGIAARSILRQRDFELKMAEKQKFEEESKKST